MSRREISSTMPESSQGISITAVSTLMSGTES
jgi:hypothetical protein